MLRRDYCRARAAAACAGHCWTLATIRLGPRAAGMFRRRSDRAHQRTCACVPLADLAHMAASIDDLALLTALAASWFHVYVYVE
jgi:hypothetical protein